MVSKRPKLITPLPGPKARAVIERSEGAISTSYTRDYPLVAEDALGCWITDPDGNEFLDMNAGIAVCSTGHCHPRVVEAIEAQTRKLIHMSGTDFYYPVQSRLAARLVSLGAVRGERHRVYFGNSGAEATECAIKLSRYHSGRHAIIGFFGSFHGRTMGALSLTSSKVRQRERFGPFVPGVYHATYPDTLRMGAEATRVALDSLDNLLQHVVSPQEVAAIVVEPIQGEGGYLVPPDAFLRGLRELCDRHGILLVMDEVQSGMGRTGRMFAWQHSGVQPDVICLAKGIASGLPLCAVIASDHVMNWLPGSHASTFGGNPVACAAAHATLDLLQEELVENAARVGASFKAMLQQAVGDHPRVAEVRGHGLMLGVELVKDRATLARDPDLRNHVVMAAFERGMLIIGCGPNTIRFCPALTITEDECAVATEIFAASLAACV